MVIAIEKFSGRCQGDHVGNDTRIPCYIDLLSSSNGKRQEELESEIVRRVADVGHFLVVLKVLETLQNHERRLTLDLYGQIGTLFRSDNHLETGKSDTLGEPW